LKSATTGISENKKQDDEIEIFPNPANNQLRIRINPTLNTNSRFFESKNITILNSFGQIILTKGLQIAVYDYTIDVNQLPAGFYIVKIGNEVQKFTIQH